MSVFLVTSVKPLAPRELPNLEISGRVEVHVDDVRRAWKAGVERGNELARKILIEQQFQSRAADG
jgi:hypothetical protein